MTDLWLCPRDETCPAVRSHDTYSGYHRGCRSGAARRDYYRYRKQLRAGTNPSRLVPSIGTRRRLQGLYALGWPWKELATRSGLDATWLGRAARGVESPHFTTRALADAVDYVFEQLSMTPGPCPRSRNYAAKAGYFSPLVWDDPDNPRERPKFGEDERATYLRKRERGVA